MFPSSYDTNCCMLCWVQVWVVHFHTVYERELCWIYKRDELYTLCLKVFGGDVASPFPCGPFTLAHKTRTVFIYLLQRSCD